MLDREAINALLEIDAQHVWHPYAPHPAKTASYLVESTEGVFLNLADGRRLVDGMSSWWTAIHGYCHPELLAAAKKQLDVMPHVMFGGLSHEPAIRLTEKLVELTPTNLQHVFFVDSGSVAIQVAMKMALQYWRGRGDSKKSKFATIRGGYHGDTFAPMSVCDPEAGMHAQFAGILPAQHFAPRPLSSFGSDLLPGDTAELETLLRTHSTEIAALILEPIVQGAGGMHFYSADYLREAQRLCRELDILLLFDEIATGFGRTGKMFALEHAEVEPDILCLGKALTGGVLSLAATLCTTEVSEVIARGEASVLMHGPTFMGNPLACSVALANLELLTSYDFAASVAQIERKLERELAELRELSTVNDVRCLGAIAVVEMKAPVDVAAVQEVLVDNGAWLRPFAHLIYAMPPFTINEVELDLLASAIKSAVRAV